MDRRSFIASASLLAVAPWASAQGFPNKPIRVISPYAAGGGPDVQLRQAGPVLGEILGQSVVIENKVGAAGVLAAQYVANQPADGYTYLMGSNTHLIQKILVPTLKFDPLGEFSPVSNLTSSPVILVVNANSPYKSAAELIDDIKAKPNTFNYGSGGIGTSAHLAGATFASIAGLKVTHIPLRGSVEITASIIRGDTVYACPVAGTAMPQITGGKLRALAVTSKSRLPQLPDVPTMQEVLKNELAVQESWFGIWAPAKTDMASLNVLNQAIQKVVATPSVKTAFETAANVAVASSSPAVFAEFVRSENSKWAEIVKLAGVTVTS